MRAQSRPSARRRGSVARLAGATYVGTLLGLVTGPIIARALGATGRGELAAVATYAGLAAVVLGLGVPNAVGYRVANTLDDAGALLGTVMRYAAILVVPSVALAVLVAYGPLAHLSSAGRMGTLVLVSLAPLAVVGGALEATVRARGELGTLARLRLLPLGFAAAVTTALWATNKLTVGSAVAITVSASLLSLAATAVAVGRRPRRGSALGPLVGFGARSLLGGLALAASSRLDQALIAPMLGPRDLGVYAVAATVSLLPLGATAAIAARAFGTIAEAPEDDRPRLAATYVRRAVVVAVALCLGLAVVIPVMLPLLYGHEFRGAILPTLLLLPATIAMSGAGSAEASLHVLGRPGAASLAQACGTVVTVVGLLVALPRFGITGAAVVTSVDFIVTLGIQIVFLRRLGAHGFAPCADDWHLLVTRLRSVWQRERSSVCSSTEATEASKQLEAR